MPSLGRGRLPALLAGNALMRIAGGANGVLAGVYLAELAGRGSGIGPGVAGTVGAASFGAELLGAAPMGLLADIFAPRTMMACGALLGAGATRLFGAGEQACVFYVSRAIEGLGAAAGLPSILAHLTDVSARDPALRARVMSYFELSLLAGLALGGLAGGELWRRLHRDAFSAVALFYLAGGGLLFFGAAGGRGHGRAQAAAGLVRALREPSLRRLAPIWLCINTIVGLWLGPVLAFLLTQRRDGGYFLDGIFAGEPHKVGWVMLGYSLIFATGVTAWSFLLPRMPVARALKISLTAMLGVCGGLWLLNHSGGGSPELRWTIGAATAMLVMVESGFTPAALTLLSGAVGARAGRGSAMGIYTALLSAGAIAGSLLGGVSGARFAVDGLIYCTLLMAVLALGLLRFWKAGTHGAS